MPRNKQRELKLSSRLKDCLRLTYYQVMKWMDWSDKIEPSELGLKEDTGSSDDRKQSSSRYLFRWSIETMLKGAILRNEE